MKNAISKSIVLAIALGLAIGCVLFFARYIVNPPESTSALAKSGDVFQPDMENLVEQYNPSEMTLKDAENAFDAILDRADIYQTDMLISDMSFIEAEKKISAEKFANLLYSWSINKFKQSIWYEKDHATILRLSRKLKSFGVKKEIQDSLRMIETVISNYNQAWTICKQNVFISYDDTRYTLKKANSYINKPYLSNCTLLKRTIDGFGRQLEKSRYHQLEQEVEKLNNLQSFSNKTAYEIKSRDIAKLINGFSNSDAFGVSTESDAGKLGEKQDYYNRQARNYFTWQ